MLYFYKDLSLFPSGSNTPQLAANINSLGNTKNRRLGNLRNTPELASIEMQPKPDIVV